jgi:hypothetical protein
MFLILSRLRNLVLKRDAQCAICWTSRVPKDNCSIRGQYFWPGMKKDVADYIARCMECQKVKTEHRHPTGLLQPFPILEWKWEVVTIDFITKFPKNNKAT